MRSNGKAVNSNLQSKCDNVSQLPQYTYHFGSFDGMVSGDAFSSLKALRKTTREPFKRGSLISIEKIKDSGAYDTFIIGSTDPDFLEGCVCRFILSHTISNTPTVYGQNSHTEM